MHIKTADDYILKKTPFTSLNNNCSGKHLSMLLYSKLLDIDNYNYQNIEHIVQQNIHNFFKEIFELDEIKYGIDGCGLPATYLNSYSFLKGVKNVLNSEYKDLWQSIFDSYNSHPNLVGGENRTDTNIMLNSYSPLLAKSGAEGVLFATNNESSFLFKCSDGNFRAVDLVATDLLNKQKYINEIPYTKLVENYSKNLQNTEVYSFNIE
jgi:L-asparaginase II